jgi:hypothetical protein
MSLGIVTEVTEGRHLRRLQIEALHLNPGVYYATIWASGPFGRPVFDRIESAIALQVVERQSSRGQKGPITCRFQVLPSN